MLPCAPHLRFGWVTSSLWISTSSMHRSLWEALIDYLSPSMCLCPPSLPLKRDVLPGTSTQVRKSWKFLAFQIIFLVFSCVCSCMCVTTLDLCPLHMCKSKSLYSLSLLFLWSYWFGKQNSYYLSDQWETTSFIFFPPLSLGGQDPVIKYCHTFLLPLFYF